MSGFLKQAVILTGLGFASSALAEEAAPPSPYTMYGSPETLQSMEPYKQTMLELSGKDIFVMSQADFFDRDTVLKIRTFNFLEADLTKILNMEAARSRMDELFEEHKDILPTTVFSKDGNTFDWSKTFKDKFLMNAIYSSPFSYQVRNEENKEKACIILVQDNDKDTHFAMTEIAGLPLSLSPLVQTKLTQEDIIRWVDFHEAAHCGQEQAELKDNVELALNRLGKEITADVSALAAFAKTSQYPAAVTEELIEEIKMLRAIANIRNSGTLLSSPGEYLSHGNHFNGAHLDMTPEDFAQVILAGQMVNMLTNLNIMMSLNLMPFTAEAAALKNNEEQEENLFFSKPSFFWDTAEQVRQDNPLIEYAIILEISKSRTTGYVFDNQKNQNILDASWFTKMMDDYLIAFETVFPEAINHPVVINHREIMAKQIAALDEYFAPIMNGEKVTVRPQSYVGKEAQADKAFNPYDACVLAISDMKDPVLLLKTIQDYRACYIKAGHVEPSPFSFESAPASP